MNHPQLPVYIQTLELDLPLDKMHDDIIDKHSKYKYSIGNNFMIEDENGYIDKLYEAFLQESIKLLGNFELRSSNKRACWAYVTNCDHYRGGIHDHIRTSVINAVYYLRMPKTDNLRDGSISFYDRNDKETFWYKPRTSDLVIFPNYLRHEPNPVSTKEHRVAINMEIQCNYNW